MRIEVTDLVWLDTDLRMSRLQLAEMSGLSEGEIDELAAFGLLHAPPEPADPPLFYGTCVTAARAASRLRNDFELSGDALALVMRLLQRIRALENELHSLRAQTPTMAP
jgi:hypothetical protein